MAKKKTSPVPAALAKAVAKVESKISKKFIWGLPYYSADSKYKLELLELGDLSLFEENDVDMDEIGPWIPFAIFDRDEAQFLCVSTKSPFAVGMWEHEDGKVHQVWDSLDALAKIVLAKKSDKTPIEKMEKDLEKANALVSKDKYADALKLLEPLMKNLPAMAPDSDYDDDDLGRAWNAYGLALNGAKKKGGREAFENAARLGSEMANLNLLDMLEEEGDWKSLLALGKKLHDPQRSDAYFEVWLAYYNAVAYAATGKAKEAEKALRAAAAEYGVKSADIVESVAGVLKKRVAKGKPDAKVLEPFLAWFGPTKLTTTKGDLAWWKKVPPAMQKELLDEIDRKPDNEVRDADIARMRKVTSLHLYESHGNFDDPTVFLELPDLERLGFYGDPESIEPLKKLKKLESLTINNDVIKNFEWPSRVQRDFWKAVEKGDKKAVEKAIKSGADIHDRDDFGRNAVGHCGYDHPKLAAWLVEQGVDPWGGSHGDGVGVGDARDTFAKQATQAGIAHPDEDAWRVLESSRERNGASFEAVESFSVDDGVPLAKNDKKVKLPIKLKMEAPKKDNKLFDFHRIKYSGFVASERLAEVLKGPSVEIHPVEIRDHAGKVRPEKYFFINPLAIDCLDPKKCFPQWNHIDPDSMSGAGAYAMDEKKIGKAQLFRLDRLNSHPAVISRALAERLKDFTGIRIEYIPR